MGSKIKMIAEKETGKTNLSREYTFWVTVNAAESSNFEDAIKKIATFNTVEDFWAIYQHLKRPDDLPVRMDYNLFADGIKPMWEDERNKGGGKWTLKVQKGYGSKLWEEIVIWRED
eukprot:TRINITY_DN7213_c0_g1_i5.p2 TRINITY_DN7213_c0_g1~~TRINITY_DN7213_c0_g1_i5.p2  ORF type:complete len:116 (+),score=39.67 TRINITY_DN7213_c0_g1_i5:135-482(+)